VSKGKLPKILGQEAEQLPDGSFVAHIGKFTVTLFIGHNRWSWDMLRSDIPDDACTTPHAAARVASRRLRGLQGALNRYVAAERKARK